MYVCMYLGLQWRSSAINPAHVDAKIAMRINTLKPEQHFLLLPTYTYSTYKHYVYIVLYVVPWRLSAINPAHVDAKIAVRINTLKPEHTIVFNFVSTYCMYVL